MVASLGLKPEEMTLSYCGRAIGDADVLWSLGCRTDDCVELEFESPCQPEMLKFLRNAPDPPPKKDKGKGKKKK